MLMHISCIRTFLFYLLVLSVDGAFLLVSFSLSLLNGLRIAPKHKSALSRNPLHSRASFDPTPIHVWFYDEKARQEFSENFSKRGIHLQCHVILLDFSDTTLPTVIHRQGWESLCEIPMSCPSVIILEFYSNMHGFDSSVPWFITHVRGTCIVVTPRYYMFRRYCILITPDVHIWGLCPKTNFCLSFVRHLLHGVIVKTPHA